MANIMSKQITVTRLKNMVQIDGMTRDEIAEKLDITRNEVNKLFQHEKLKGIKPGKQASYILVDDTVESYQEAPAQTMEEIHDEMENTHEPNAEEVLTENQETSDSEGDGGSGWEN